MSFMPFTRAHSLRVLAAGLALLCGCAAKADGLTVYHANQDFGAAMNCLEYSPERCASLLGRYVLKADAALTATRSPAVGQELRLRATQRRLRDTAAELRRDAVDTLDPALQERAMELERIAHEIDALLGNLGRPAPMGVPPAPAATVQVVEVLPAAQLPPPRDAADLRASMPMLMPLTAPAAVILPAAGPGLTGPAAPSLP